MKKPVMLITALVLLLSLIGYKVYVKVSQNISFSREVQGTGKQRSAAVPMVKTYEVTPRPIKETLELVGAILPETEVALQPRVSGRLLSLAIEEGQYLRQGTVIGEIDPETLRIQLQQSLANLSQIEAALQQAQVNVSRLKLERERYYELFKKKYVSESEYENTNSAFLSAQAALEGVRAQQSAAAKNCDLLQIQLRDTKITTPTSGYVLKKHATPGTNLTTGSTIATIVPLERVKLSFRIEQSQAGRIRQGMPVQFLPEASADKVYRGQVGPITPTYNPQTRSLELTAILPNSDQKLLPGMFGTVEIALGAKENALAIPTSALLEDNGRQGVYVVNPAGNTEFRAVEIGMTTQGNVEILTGLRQHDRVIIVGQNRLRHGQPVEVLGEQSKGTGQRNKSRVKGGANH